jgi:asparagine synthase (glutamine-hydrolysing)
MGKVLVHRGPDDVGSLELPWISLGHRRLSIIDLATGHQPLANEDETVWLVYNGEVYNYRELRAELVERGHVFKTNSDSEVIVHAYEEYGPDCFKGFNGMWAVVLADLRRNRLILARDHFGIKPLYYTIAGGRLLFASEIKALLQDPSAPSRPNDQMVYEYLVHGLHDHKPETFFEGIYHLMPATYAEIDGAAMAALSDGEGLAARAVTYWTPELSEDGSADPDEFRRLFEKTVERRLVAEVPVGSCLSGGLDSTSIVSFMSGLLKSQTPDAASLRGQLKTFSAVFDNDPIDERDYIAEAVKATGADTTYIRPTSEDFVEELRDFIWHQEEPLISTGPYAQWCVMREARKQVTVLLDGQGGDELLAGYVPYQYVYLAQLWKERKYGRFLREVWAARDVLKPLLTRRLRDRRKGFPLRSLLRKEFTDRVVDPGYTRSRNNLKLRLLQDLTTYSLPCLLRYEDKNSMAHSLESRVPYLDQELVEWILRLPSDVIIRDGWSRWILRTGLKGVLPEKIRRRRWKVGFTTPEIRWIKARRAAFTSLLRSPSFANRPYWDGEAVARAFLAANRGKIDFSMFFWRVINVELWLREFIDARAVDELIAAEPGAGAARTAPNQAALDEAAEAVAAVAATAETSPTRGRLADLGDRLAVRLTGTGEAARLAETYRPNAGKHLFAAVGGRVYARLPVKTGIVKSGDDLVAFFKESVGRHVQPGDIVVIAEKPVAISQGRSFPIEEIEVTWLAKALSKAVTKTPHGIGLGIPQTMQLALNEAGAPRILLATAVSAVARVFGRRGIFYKIAGPTVEAIDGPTPGTLPPYNRQAKLGPKDPMDVAAKLAAAIGPQVGVAIIDASDLTADVLGHAAGVDPRLVETLMRDNPLGQGHQQTPIAILREVGRLAAVA